MSDLGFKALDIDNIAQRDPIIDLFGKATSEGSTVPLSNEDLTGEILRPQLAASVPKDVRALYEVARGCMCYGYFFYPLFMLGTEQLYRVIEAAVTARCDQLSPRKPMKSFGARVDFLIRRGIIPKADRLRWKGTRELRNIASHPIMQSQMPPGYAIHRLEQSAGIINSLFGSA